MELRKLRKENKYTQEQIAKYLNMSQSAYQHYENERAEPSIETLCKLADFYKVFGFIDVFYYSTWHVSILLRIFTALFMSEIFL